ncbi:hypothetical protein [Undibacterium sp. TJN19]|uniref:hypothetical protein n=1 Tax=Undibacterium sp. TJN19 TaxID=3413055 RepID=UPI003BF444E2
MDADKAKFQPTGKGLKMNTPIDNHPAENQLVVIDHTQPEGNENMKQTTHNPVLDFVKNLADAMAYVGQQAHDWIMQASWKKILLVSLLTLMTGGLIHLSSLAKGLVFVSVIVKLFGNKEEQTLTTH